VPKLPRISGDEAVKAFKKLGWELSRQRGSHQIMTKSGSIYTLSIPAKATLAPGLLRDLIGKAGLTVEEFTKLL
jgi:predicted RNA binding protein YcfA (HicA-like mRNA interferase family)